MSALARALLADLTSDELRWLADELAPYLPDRSSRGASDAWLNSRQAAEHLGLSVHALHRLTSARQVPFHQDGPGCRCWFRRAELDAWRSR